jgi:hypothetical protein
MLLEITQALCRGRLRYRNCRNFFLFSEHISSVKQELSSAMNNAVQYNLQAD